MIIYLKQSLSLLLLPSDQGLETEPILISLLRSHLIVHEVNKDTQKTTGLHEPSSITLSTGAFLNTHTKILDLYVVQ